MNIDQTRKFLSKVLKEKNVFVRAENEWIDWNDFETKRSMEDLQEQDDDFIDELIADIEKGRYKNRYDIHGHERPDEMIAKGVNAIKISDKNFCNVIHFLENMGYDDEDFVFVVFIGKSLGKNLYGDGNIVIPEKLLKIFLPSELFKFCDKCS